MGVMSLSAACGRCRDLHRIKPVLTYYSSEIGDHSNESRLLVAHLNSEVRQFSHFLPEMLHSFTTTARQDDFQFNETGAWL